VFLVNGDVLRNSIETDWIGGGHYYVPYHFIPENEIWLEQLGEGERELEDILLHEFIERKLMKYKKFSYENGHKIATEYEKMYRRKENNNVRDLHIVIELFLKKYFGESAHDKKFIEDVCQTISKIKL